MSSRRVFVLAILAILLLGLITRADAASAMKRYYAYDAVEDKYGVIAPWYKGLNGQCDFRVRIAAETLKRYPWTTLDKAPAELPAYDFSGHWIVGQDGTIMTPMFSDWDNGDLGQRAAYVLSALVDYYRYSGDPAAIAHITYLADFLLDYCQTPADNPWPNMLISVPFKGKPFGKCDPKGMIQLDIVTEVGAPLLKAYEITGNTRWFEAAKHWADLIAEHRSKDPNSAPWPRYANPEAAPWNMNQLTGGVAWLCYFFDDLIRLGYTGKNNSIVEARDAGRAYLRDKLLPKWTENISWAGNYWDNPCVYQCESVTDFACRYMLDNRDYFPNWRNDVRNILSLFLNRTSVNANSSSEVYSGAWAYPESSGCCGRSLWYGPMELAVVYAQYGVEANSDWARELALRSQTLATYDCHETGVSEDNIDGGGIVCPTWFKIAHPMALKHVLATMAWMPEEFGASRENHIMRSTAVVSSVIYGKGKITYSTYDAPANTTEVLRLAFAPSSITADGKPLAKRKNLKSNGYTIKALSSGDCIVTVRHDGSKNIIIEGNDPQEVSDDAKLAYEGEWETSQNEADFGGSCKVAQLNGAEMSFKFTGNQVRLIGRADMYGGLADVYIDGVKQIVGIDCWNPSLRNQQVLYYKNGLSEGEHTLRVAVKGARNPKSGGTNVYVDAVQWSNADGMSGYPSGSGPTSTQRFICGYPKREDYIDSEGNKWKPMTEMLVRTNPGLDPVVVNWWTEPCKNEIAGTKDAEIYRYGIHGDKLVANITVAPGTYYVRLKFAATHNLNPIKNCVTVLINGEEKVKRMNIEATADSPNKAVDLVFNDIRPKHGVIDITFIGGEPNSGLCSEAFVQGIEVGPGNGGQGAVPVRVTYYPGDPGCKASPDNLLINPGFEEGVAGTIGPVGSNGGGCGWLYAFSSKTQCYIWPESDYIVHPDWGLPEIHCGCNAVRTHSDRDGHTQIYQDAEVEPNVQYKASVWLRTVDLRGVGFGKAATDSAGLIVQELDKDSNLVAEWPKLEVKTAGSYTQLAHMFTTTPATKKVRFVLDTVIACPYNEGHVTYDDCALVKVH